MGAWVGHLEDFGVLFARRPGHQWGAVLEAASSRYARLAPAGASGGGIGFRGFIGLLTQQPKTPKSSHARVQGLTLYFNIFTCLIRLLQVRLLQQAGRGGALLLNP